MNYTRIFVTIASAAIVAAGCDTYDGNQDPIGATGRQGATLRAVHDTGTRTDFDGKASAWTDGDAMSVICTSPEKEAQVIKFTVTDPAKGIFESDGAALDPDTKYDVYAVYPYNTDKITVGAGSDDARFDIGAAKQTQQGSSASHIAALDPLTGCVKAVTPDNISLLMHHTATAISIRLANGTGESLSGISSLTITAPDGIVLAASHAIDLADGAIKADGATTSNTIEVAVESSGKIPAGGEFTVWAAAAPFSMRQGESLRFDITADDGTRYTAVKTFDAERRFAAGTVMSTTVELSAATEVAETITVSVDLTDAASYPDNFPKAEYYEDNATPIDNVYMFGGYPFRFYCTAPYFHHESGGKTLYLNIKNISDRTSADIALPIIEGYAPTRIAVSTHESCKNRNLNISTVDPAGKILQGTKIKNTFSRTNIYKPVGTDDKTEYRIRITGSATSNPCPVTAMEITYKHL